MDAAQGAAVSGGAGDSRGTGAGVGLNSNSSSNGANGASRQRFSFSRVVPEQGKKRVNYGKGDARRIMEEAVSLCEAMTLGYEVVFHGRRRSSGQRLGSGSEDNRLGRCAVFGSGCAQG